MIETKDLPSIVPHRGKMLLLSRITGYNLEECSLEAEYDITENCIFFDPAVDGVPSWVCFECIAQAIAAFSGIRSREKDGKDEKCGKLPRIGFILSISKMQVFLPVLKSDNTIIIKVKELDRTDLVFNFEGQVFLEGTKVLEGTLTVMETQAAQAAIISTSLSSTTEGSYAAEETINEN
ncbi:MAG: 3-hydroxylacyl-ACP dehydratase [Treponema sp.]|nr:3-hydroxylacyl-ACP dehydratase [Treponema sp.]